MLYGNELSFSGIYLSVNGQVMEMDISKQLQAYEVEYHVLQDEMLESGPLPDDSERLDKLEKTNAQLKKQNMELLEKLQVRKWRFKPLWDPSPTHSPAGCYLILTWLWYNWGKHFNPVSLCGDNFEASSST